MQDGIVRAAFRESLTTLRPITPGEVYEYIIDLGPVSARVPAGARLRIDVPSSDFPQSARNFNSGYPATECHRWPPRPFYTRRSIPPTSRCQCSPHRSCISTDHEHEAWPSQQELFPNHASRSTV